MSRRSRPPTGEASLRAREPATTVELATPTEVTAPPANRSEPLRVISMKLPAASAPKPAPERAPRKAVIRALADVHNQRQTPPGGMGYLAPARDVKGARARRRREWLLWGSVVVIIGCAVTLVVWFLAAP